LLSSEPLGFDLLPEVMHPIIIATSIKIAAQAVSFQLSLLPPQSRVLAMCVIACSSLISFHEAVLGPGLRPESFYDPTFFSSQADVRSCGIQRAAACRAFHTAALKAAWDAGIMLQVSMENAASCFLLDLLEQSEQDGNPLDTFLMLFRRLFGVVETMGERLYIASPRTWPHVALLLASVCLPLVLLPRK
jgi:hypothetical protein